MTTYIYVYLDGKPLETFLRGMETGEGPREGPVDGRP